LAQLAREGAAARRGFFAVLRQHVSEPVGDGGIVGRGARVSRLRQLAAQRERRRAVVGVELDEHGRIILGIDHHRHPVVVLGRRTGHRRAADVDVLDGLLEAGAFGDGGFERIEIADQQIDTLDAVRPASPRRDPACRAAPAARHG